MCALTCQAALEWEQVVSRKNITNLFSLILLSKHIVSNEETSALQSTSRYRVKNFSLDAQGRIKLLRLDVDSRL
jgi:hypothetical protein